MTTTPVRRTLSTAATLILATLAWSAGTTRAGLSGEVPPDEFVSQARDDVNSDPENGDGFGSAIAQGDFNGDGLVDLAVGVSGETFGSAAQPHGVVQVFFRGTDGSLTGGGQQFITPSDLAPHNTNDDALQAFGFALTAGDFVDRAGSDDDGIDDLAISAPFADRGGYEGIGVVHVLPGTTGGLALGADSLAFDARAPGFPGGPLDDAWTGYDLATGDFDDDGQDDLVIGSPRSRPAGGYSNTGMVTVMYQRNGSLNTADAVGLPHFTDDDAMGGMLAIGDFDGDGDDDVAAATMVLGRGTTGLVWRSDEATSSGFDRLNPTRLDAASLGVPSDAIFNFYGAGLASGDFDHDGIDDVALFWRVDGGATGTAVAMMRPSDTGEVLFDVDRLDSGDDGLGTTSSRLGSALAAGDFDGDDVDDLALYDTGTNRLYEVPGRRDTGLDRRAAEDIGGYSSLGRLDVVDRNADGVDDLALLMPSGTVDGVNDAGLVKIEFGANARPITFSPRRLLDTRGGPTFDDRYSGDGPVGEGESIRVPIAGRAGIPADATGAIVNVAIVRPDDSGYATVYPCGDTLPTASTVNYLEGDNRANAATIALDDEGYLCVYTLQEAHVLVDVTGYTTGATAVSTRTPIRVLETREGNLTYDGEFEGIGRRTASSITRLQLGGRDGIPAGHPMLLNLTVINPSGPGYATVWDCEGAIPNASTLNYAAGQTVANGVVAAPNAGDEVCIFTFAAADLVVDLTGDLGVSSRVEFSTPARMIDTRPGNVTVDGELAGIGRVGAGTIVEIPIAGRGDVPGFTRTAIVNLAIVNPDDDGFATLFPCGDDVPTVSNVNVAAGSNTANNAIVQLSGSGSVCLVTSVDTHAVLDVSGWVE